MTPAHPTRRCYNGLCEDGAQGLVEGECWWQRAVAVHRETSTWEAALGATAADRARMLRRRTAHVDAPEFTSLSGSPELQEMARAGFEAFLRWWSPPLSPREGRPRRGSPADVPGVSGRLIDLVHPTAGADVCRLVVTQIERDIRHRARPFRFGIDVVVVTGPDVLSQEGHHASISVGLKGDPARYRDLAPRHAAPPRLSSQHPPRVTWIGSSRDHVRDYARAPSSTPRKPQRARSEGTCAESHLPRR